MTAILFDPANALDSRERFLRGALFLATFLQICLTAAPFPDLSDPALLNPAASAGKLGSQLLTLLITGSLAIFAVVKRLNLVLRAVTPVLVLTLAWFAFSAIFSAHPDLALRRLVLSGFTIFQAAVFVLLPQDREHFARLLATGAVIVLVLCFAGVLLAPEHSIHTVHDIAEPVLAGDWRGFFAHKNGAGAAMVLLIIFGIFIARTSSVGLGILIIAPAALFLAFTRSKSPLNLLPLVLIFGALLARLRSPAAKYLAAASVPTVLAVLTIGSITSDSVHALVQLLPDPGFTGRDEIWRFALDHIAQRPITGFGYQAFWGTSELVSDWNYLESWGYRASDAHNGFLNVAVMTGLPGLALALIWVFFRSLRDLSRTPRERIDPALTMLFLQIWLFDLYLCSFESELFNNGSLVWFMTLVAVIGLRFQATAEYAPGSA